MYFNIDWQFEMIKRDKGYGHDTCAMILGLSVNFILFSSFSVTYVVGTSWDSLTETISMGTYNTCLFNK